MSFSAESPPPGWYPDPAGSGGERYWDGGNWSQVTRPAGGLGAPQAPQQAQPSPYGATPASQGYYGAGVMRQPMLAGFWWRVLAAILDNIILTIPLGLVQRLVAGDAIDALSLWLADWTLAVTQGLTPPPLPEGAIPPLYLYLFVSVVLLIIYRTVLVATRGGTLGQLITGLRVVPDGSGLETTPSWGTSGIRAATAVVFGQVPLLNLIDPLSMLFTAKKQTLHDKIAHTVVIKK
ncbi:RDD family protein [Tessaracoccus antarcticus]|nr:RDD family protein [Tessaracoccus antarcticus]